MNFYEVSVHITLGVLGFLEKTQVNPALFFNHTVGLHVVGPFYY
jgi:hypothetical protein